MHPLGFSLQKFLKRDGNKSWHLISYLKAHWASVTVPQKLVIYAQSINTILTELLDNSDKKIVKSKFFCSVDNRFSSFFFQEIDNYSYKLCFRCLSQDNM